MLQSRNPRGAPPLVNALTVDFEDWYQGLEIPYTRWAGYEDRLPASGRRLLALFAECNVHATFFILGAVAERHPELVREIASAGHEIATHGWSHTLVYEMTPETFRDELVRSIRLLETLTGQRIVGHRAPFFSITRRSLWALDILGEEGLHYDSSIFPVLNYRYGIEDAPRWPHPVREGVDGLIEFPISTWRVLGRNLPVAGGAYFRMFPYALTRTALRSINREGRPVVFYIHPWEVDPEHPRIPLPRRIAATHYFNLKSTEGRLRRLLGDFRFAPMKEVLGLDRGPAGRTEGG
jgi:polysaccharide deacetylase family protein (PEP-CTERM system associated)